MSKIVAIHQPYFIPWLGFFDKAKNADILVILDNVLAPSKNTSYLNKNTIKTANGPLSLKVPIHSSYQAPINKITIDNSQPWRENHLKTFFFNYKKAKNFDNIYKILEKIYSRDIELISELNFALINSFFSALNITPKIQIASDLKVKSSKNDLLIELTQRAGGDTYLSGSGAKEYLDEEKFRRQKIKIVWQSYKTPHYKQLWGEFTPNLSALDYLFCDGTPLG